MNTIRHCLPALALLLATACKQQADKPDVVAANIDSTANPADDFFQYANGGWIKKNAIPDEQSNWGIGNLVREENLRRLLTINEEAAKKAAAKGSAEQKIGDFWKAAMDSNAIEKKGLEPLRPWLGRIDTISSIAGVQAVMADMTKIGNGTLVSFYVGQDDMNSEQMKVKFWQDGLSLPEREYYFKQDSTSVALRNAFKNYIATTLKRSGVPEAEAVKAGEDILAMETGLAKAHRPMAALRDPYKNYNKMAAAAFYKMAPAADMEGMLSRMGVKTDTVIVGQPEYFAAVNEAFKKWPVSFWKNYLRSEMISSYAEALPQAYGEDAFAYGKLFSGAKQRRPRWKRTLSMEEGVMGELLGQLFVKTYFNDKAKARYNQMVEDIRGALKKRIGELTWMSDTTKQKAYVKLAAMKKKVGYPDKWKDFSGLEIVPDNYVQNLMKGNRFWFDYNLNKLGKPVDREEWDMTPQTYNAYYNPSNNEIVLPAGIFTVPGYLDEELDDAVVYGYGGASTIGHEITHGFDDEGRQFDEKGNLKSWWTKGDEARFNDRAKVMVTQFAGYMPIDTFKINGEATLGENIADLGGILLGWEAFKNTEQYKEGKSIAGLTPAQRYFHGYALGWLSNTRPESLRNQVLSDVHSPAKFRVNGPFASVPAFYDTYKPTAASKMYLAPDKRVQIW